LTQKSNFVGTSKPLVSGKDIRLQGDQVPPKTFRLDGQIMQRTRQWVPNRRSGDWGSPGAKCAATIPAV